MFAVLKQLQLAALESIKTQINMPYDLKSNFYSKVES